MKTSKVTVYKADTFRNLPKNAEAFIAFFQKQLNLIPEEFRSSATIDLETNPFYDSVEETIEVCYYRPETEEEIQAREREAASKDIKERQKKLAKFEKSIEARLVHYGPTRVVGSATVYSGRG